LTPTPPPPPLFPYTTLFRSADDLDMVIHVGDYIYESSWGRDHVRTHGAPEPHTLDDYRIRHALYKGDPDLQAAHAAYPWVLTWEDRKSTRLNSSHVEISYAV